MAKGQKKTFVDRAERRPVSMRGFALSPTRDSDIAVADLSYTGCQLTSDDRFKPGEVVELRILKQGAIQAEIRWSADGRAGALFLD
jgi:hypothetical protein